MPMGTTGMATSVAPARVFLAGDTRMTDLTLNAMLVGMLMQLYTEAEAFRFLTSPQPLFNGVTGLDMIATGRTDDLILSLRRLLDGVYI